MDCCGGNDHGNNNKANQKDSHGNNHQSKYNDGFINSKSSLKLPIIIGVLLLAGLLYYLIR